VVGGYGVRVIGLVERGFEKKVDIVKMREGKEENNRNRSIRRKSVLLYVMFYI
jgi:hypothetical protein